MQHATYIERGFPVKEREITTSKKGKYTLHEQGKMANTTTIQEQIEMSGLEIMSSLPSSSPSLSSLSLQLQWNSTNQWSPLLGGGRDSQACVTIESGNENGAGGQTIVVIGGANGGECTTNSVIVCDPSTKRWRNGPSLNDKRSDLVAVVCHDKVYVIGGYGDDNYHGYTTLDTIESIQVSSLLETVETSMMTRQNNNQWTRLQCHLSIPRHKCAAVVVQNRYIVILGGVNGMRQDLSSVHIMDTAPPHNNNNSNGEPMIVAGPSMNLARYDFGAAVVDNQIFVVGGWVSSGRSTSVESLLFQQQPKDKDKDHINTYSNVSCTFPNSSWRKEPHLSLSSPQDSHAVSKVGLCLVVAGGHCKNHGGWTNTFLEVLDIQRGMVWSLPNLTIPRPYGCSMVTLSDCLLVLGGNHSEDSVESLALTASRKHERCFIFLKFLNEIEFLGRPTTNLQFPMRLTGNGNQICCCCLS